MPVGGPHFGSVRKAREALRERAFELLDGYIKVIKQAASEGDFETAAKGYQYLMDHMPEEDGLHMLDISVDRPKQLESKHGPQITIGFALGGVPQASLPAPLTIDVVPEPVDE